MHNQSDYGYPVPGSSARCIACGRYELYCCNGKGNPTKRMRKELRKLAQRPYLMKGQLRADAFYYLDKASYVRAAIARGERHEGGWLYSAFDHATYLTRARECDMNARIHYGFHL